MGLIRDKHGDDTHRVLTHEEHRIAMLVEMQELCQQLQSLKYKEDKKAIFRKLGDLEELRHMVIRNYLPKEQDRAEQEYAKMNQHNKVVAETSGGFFKQLSD